MPKVQVPGGHSRAEGARLTRLRVKNYRSLEAVDVPLASLSSFVGPNGTGKTTIYSRIERHIAVEVDVAGDRRRESCSPEHTSTLGV